MKTYLDIVNIVLRDLNEVPLTAANFSSAVGFQSFIKESVNRALLDIINYNDEWPWLANAPLYAGVSSHTNEFVTVAGVAEYLLPTTIDTIDFDNVYLTTDDKVKPLALLSIDEVTDNVANLREDEPHYVYRVPNNKYMGLQPTPDDVYTIKYVSWKEPTILDLYNDEIPFPDRYYTVLVSRARYYAWMFRENAQQASMALNEYESNLKYMFKNLMLPKSNHMRAI